MRAFLQIFSLEFLSAVRSRALLLLALASLAWTFFLPYLIRGDGTAAGEYQLYVHYALGGVCLLLTASLAATAAGSLARDRAARRLPLTTVRPVRYALVALGRVAALTALGALVLALGALATVARLETYPKSFVGAQGASERMDFSLTRACYHVLSPILPKSAREEALEAYEKYRTDPATSNNVAGVERSVALDILTQRAEERYDLIAASSAAEWNFAEVPSAATRLAVRMKFSGGLDSRGDFHGRLTFGNLSAGVSNVTEAVLVAPLVPTGLAERVGARVGSALRFDNESGKAGVMLRPRKDLQLLYGGARDVFALNLVYAYLASVAMIALVVSAALFLSAALSRSVAIFTTLVLLIAAEISPAILDECTEDEATGLGDRIGMRITNLVAKSTRSIGEAHPLETLSNDECVEAREVGRALLVDLGLAPLLFALLSGLVIPRKTD